MPQEPEQGPGDMSSVKGRGAGSSISLIGANGVGLLTGMITLRLLTTRLGTVHYGELVTVLTLTSVFVLLTDIGVSAVTSRDLARRPADASSILSLSLGFRWALCGIAVPLLWLVGLLLYPHAPTATRVGIVLLSLSLPFDASSAVLMSYFTASIRGWVTASWGAGKGVLTAVALATVLLLGGGVVGCVIVYLCASILASLVAAALVRTEVRFRPRFKDQPWREVGAASLSIGSIQLVNVLYLKFDILLLSVMTNPRLVGLYGVAYAIINIINWLPSIVMGTVFPVFSRMSPGSVPTMVDRSAKSLIALGALAAAGSISLGPRVIAVLSGPHFAAANVPLSILSVAFLFTFPSTAIGTAAVALNKISGLLKISLLGLVINGILNVAMIPSLGLGGAALATVLSELFVAGALIYNFWRSTGFLIPLWRHGVRPIIAAGVALLATSLLPTIMGPALASIALGAAVLTLLFVGILWLIGGLPQEGRDVVSWIVSRLRRSPRGVG